MTDNKDIAKILFEISEYLAMQGVQFKPRAYEKAAQAIFDLEESVEDIYKARGLKGLEEIPGVGKSIAEKIEEYIKTGEVGYHSELRSGMPVDVEGLARIEGVGPKTIQKLYRELGIRTVGDLEKAARAGKIRTLEGFGEKSEEKILKSLEFSKRHSGRFLLGEVVVYAERIKERMEKVPGVTRVAIAGSYRRRKETVGDLDVLVVSENPEAVMDAFVAQPEVERVLAHGPTKSSVTLRMGMDVDIRVVPPESYGAALAYFTGSKAHNVRMREIAQKKGMKLNEYGLYKGSRLIAGKSEEEVYRALGLSYVEPEMRENTGEIELAKRGALPKLISYGEIKGDLQVQSDWTDGAHSIEELARAAMELGLEYFAVTDHTKRLAMAHGLDEERVRKQMAEIDRLNKKFRGKIKILKGTECDILKDGSLDLPDNLLQQLDVVGASVHSFFNLSKRDQTERIIRAMENPHVDILFHPTGRLIQKRKAYEVDMDKLIHAAKRTGTVMEANGSPDRLDLNDEYIRKCVDAGVKIAIDSDAHTKGHFAFLDFGVAQARRGWAKKSDVVNAWPLTKCLAFLKDAKG